MASNNQRQDPAPRFSLEAIMKYIFSQDEVASYLVSRDPLPPTSLGVQVMNHSISANSLLTTDPTTAAILVKRPRVGLYQEMYNEDNESSGEMAKAMVLAAPPQVEHLVHVLHQNSEDVAFLTGTDSRSPLTFLEKPSVLERDLHRIVCIKLKGFQVSSAHAMVTYYHRQDGRSNMVILCYGLEPKPFSEKHFVLLERYPPYRYPKFSDVLETLVGIEEYLCSYCTIRGSPVCGCPASMIQRMTAPIPPKNQRSGWDIHKWIWGCYELGMKKYVVKLHNLRLGATHVMRTYHETSSAFGSNEVHKLAFQHYIDSLKSYFDQQLVSAPCLFLEGISPEMEELAFADDIEDIEDGPDEYIPLSAGLAVIDEILAGTKSQNIFGIGENNGEQPNKKTSSCSPEQKQIVEAYIAEIDTWHWAHGERRECRLCPDSTFNRKHDLKRHLRSMHLGQRDFRCDVCAESFLRKSHLQTHIKGMHLKSSRFACKFCDRVFVYESTRFKHMKNHHADKVASDKMPIRINK